MAVTTGRRKRLQSTLAAAVAHPLRARCLTVFAERVASPAEISRELMVDVSKVGYHVSALRDANLIEEVGQRPVRGAIEHFYRAIELPIVTTDQEPERSEEDRRNFSETILSVYAASASHAIEAGTFLARPDHHHTRVSVNVDEAGWKEMTEAYMELYDRVFEIREAAAERMAKSDEEPIRVVSFQSLFEAPRSA